MLVNSERYVIYLLNLYYQKNENDKTQNGGKKQLEKYDPDIADENDIVIVCSRSSEERPKI